jgi:hypothetical protein
MANDKCEVVTVTSKIVESFVTAVDKDSIYNLTELKTIIADIYREHNNNKRVTKKRAVKKENVKPKRKLSAYNVYIRTRVAELKLEQPNTPAKLFMSMAAAEWKDLSDEDKQAYKEALKIQEEIVIDIDMDEKETEED